MRSGRDDNQGIRRAAYVSGGLHLLLLVSFLLVIPPMARPPEPPEPTSVEMDFTGPPSQSRRGDQPTTKPVPAPSAVEKVAPVSPTPHAEPAPPAKVVPSHRTQPNKTANVAPDTSSLLATLEKFRADQPQTHPPRAHANPDQGGSPSRAGDVTGQLGAGAQKAIGNEVRRCYAEDTEAKNYASFTAHLLVTVDAGGEARLVEFKPDTAARMAADPGYRALAERARDAVLNPTCARLPIPASLLGRTQQLSFVFRP